MIKFKYVKPTDSRATPFVKIDAADGDDLTETQALIMILDQIDSRLLDIAQSLNRR